jgi:hypothetical protein
MPTSISRSRVLAALTIAVGLLLGTRCGLSTSDVLCLAPALLIAATLLLRRYPGERLLTALVARRCNGRKRRAGGVASPSRPAARVPRGGLLIACALAVRPPPAALMS